MVDVFDKFKVFGDKKSNNDIPKTPYASGKLTTEKSKEIYDSIQSEIDKLKTLDYSPSVDNVQSQNEVMASMNKINAINKAVQAQNILYENLVMQELIKDMIGQIQDPNHPISDEKKFRFMELVAEDRRLLVDSMNQANAGGKGGININVSNSANSEGASITNQTNKVEKALFSKQEIKGIEGLLESAQLLNTKILENQKDEGLNKLVKDIQLDLEKDKIITVPSSSDDKNSNSNK